MKISKVHFGPKAERPIFTVFSEIFTRKIRDTGISSETTIPGISSETTETREPLVSRRGAALYVAWDGQLV